MSDFDLPQMRDWSSPALDTYAAGSLLHRDAALSDVVARCAGRLVYLATPYSKLACCDNGQFNPAGSLKAAFLAARWAGLLADRGITAVSPVIQAVAMVHCDPDDTRLDPLDAEFWEGWCRPFLAASGMVVVPPILGWQDSDGIWVEVCDALRAQKHVLQIDDAVPSDWISDA